MLEAYPGIGIKIQRARLHLDELRSRIDSYTQASPFEIVRDFDQDTGEEVRRFHLAKPIPAMLAAILGDCVHNARSALDHLACAAVEKGGSAITFETQFPIYRDAAELERKYPTRMAGASAKAKDIVFALKPYKGADNQFWRLHRLDIEDKHKLLVPCVATHATFDMTTDFPEGSEFAITNLSMYSDKIVSEGDELIRFRVLDGDASDLDRTMHFGFDISFGKTEVTSGQPMLALLEMLIRQVETAAEAFDREL